MPDDAPWIDEAAAQQAAPPEEQTAGAGGWLAAIKSLMAKPSNEPRAPGDMPDGYFNYGPLARPPLYDGPPPVYRQAYPPGVQPPQQQLAPNYPTTREGEIELYNRIVGPTPLPRARPPEADQPPTADDEWERMSEKQKTLKRQEQIRIYNQIMKGQRAR